MTDDAGALRDRLRGALPAAIKARDAVAVAALRSAADAYERAGRPDQARRPRAEADLLGGYLARP
jgi:uncharacterized protein YqeY